MNKEIKTLNQIKPPSEVINIALAETLASSYADGVVTKFYTLYVAIYRASEAERTIPEVCELIKGFGGNAEEFAGNSGGIYDPDDWSPEVKYAKAGEFYAGFQINKAFFLMMMEEWFAANPAEDSWEAVAKWKMEIKND